MTRNRGARNGNGPASFAGLCKLCWKRADKMDRTDQGYHIECAKEAASILMDLMHSKRGLVYEEFYRKRYPGRPIPGVPIGGPDPPSKG